MKLSTRARYGLRAILDLAVNFGKEPILLKDVAQREEISERYLEHIVLSLKAAGLVKSMRGSHGGFMLARSPAEIKISEIINVLEGSLCLVECVDDPKACSRIDNCVTRDIWQELKKSMDAVLESRTLQDLVDKQLAKKQTNKNMYFI